jgi:hypothetical protein
MLSRGSLVPFFNRDPGLFPGANVKQPSGDADYGFRGSEIGAAHRNRTISSIASAQLTVNSLRG